MPGTVVVSVDAELAWGYRDRASFPLDRIERARAGWRHLVELFDRFDMPATWAVVGHLVRDREDGFRTDHLPVDEREFSGPSRPDLWFAEELVESVLDARADHELACHSFSHVRFDETETSREAARAELAASVETAAELGVSYDSFVFPRNRIGHLDLLAEYGFRCYRGPSPVHRRGSSVTKPLRHALRGTALGNSSLLVEPVQDEHGLVNVPASLFLFSFEGTPRRLCTPIVGDPIVRKARRGIEQAARRDGVFHVWLHPNDLHADHAVDRVEAILSVLAERRDESALSVETMRSVAERVRHGGSRIRNS